MSANTELSVVAVLSCTLSAAALLVFGAMLHHSRLATTVAMTTAFGVVSAVTLFLYGVALFTTSASTANFVGFVFLTVFTSALLLAVLLLIAPDYPTPGRFSATLVLYAALVLTLMSLLMYWEGASVLGFISPPLLVLGTTCMMWAKATKRHNQRTTHSVVFALLLLLSAFLLFTALFACLGSSGRRDWPWSFALLVYSANVGYYVHKMPADPTRP
jgi:hypothetical protein